MPLSEFTLVYSKGSPGTVEDSTLILEVQPRLCSNREIGNFTATKLNNHTLFAQPLCLSIFVLSQSNSAISKEVISKCCIFSSVVLLGGLGVFPIAALAFLGALAMILSRTLPLKEAYGSMEWSLLMLIAGMTSLGLAMEHTGTAEYLARAIIGIQQSPSPHFLLGVFFLLTVLLTQPLSNAAAALVVLPMAVHVALAQGVNPRSYAMAVSIAASCSFLTPLEPACALVYNPGKYRVRDFLRAGTGLTAVVFLVTMLLIPVLWPLK